MKKRWLSLCFPFVALILEILPYGAVCNFGNPDGEPFRETFSYFDLTPFGYANFAPFITAVLTCVILLMCIVYFFSGSRKAAVAAKWVLSAAAAVSLMPLLFGVSFFSAVGALITASLLAGFLFFQICGKNC